MHFIKSHPDNLINFRIKVGLIPTLISIHYDKGDSFETLVDRKGTF